jgi:hypothetical protein
MRSGAFLFVQEAHKSILKIQKHGSFHPVSCFSVPTKLAFSWLRRAVENLEKFT